MDKSLILAQLVKDGKIGSGGGADDAAEIQDYIDIVYETTGEKVFPIASVIANDVEMTYEEYNEEFRQSLKYTPDAFLSNRRFSTVLVPSSNPAAEVEVYTLNNVQLDTVANIDDEKARICIVWSGSVGDVNPAPQPIILHVTYITPL